MLWQPRSWFGNWDWRGGQVVYTEWICCVKDWFTFWTGQSRVAGVSITPHRVVQLRPTSCCTWSFQTRVVRVRTHCLSRIQTYLGDGPLGHAYGEPALIVGRAILCLRDIWTMWESKLRVHQALTSLFLACGCNGTPASSSLCLGSPKGQSHELWEK